VKPRKATTVEALTSLHDELKYFSHEEYDVVRIPIGHIPLLIAALKLAIHVLEKTDA
jgi:hypothetical protein